MSEAARSHRSDLRVEPYMDPPPASRSDAGNPLAELAQLVGNEDPFRNIFRQGRSSAEPAAAFPLQAANHDDHTPYHGDLAEADDAEASDDTQALGLRPSSHDEQDWSAAHAEGVAWDEAYDPQHPADAAYDGHADQPHDHAADLPIESPHYVAPPLTPDLWAEDGVPADEAQTGGPALSDEAAADAKAPRRPLVVLLAVLALTGGGLAATFLSRTASTASVTPGSTPTIMAATGPTKIKQTDGTTETTPEDADAALLNKKGASGGGVVRVVNSQEQPIDLGQLPKTANGQGDAASASSSPFPEPKKVKTFLVRPDGSLVTPAGSGAAAAPARPGIPQFVAGMPPEDGAQTTAAPRPSTPKTGSRAATTPKAAPTSISDLTAPDAANADATPAKPKQSASPGAKSAGTSKPVEMADTSAPDATATTGPGGNFALQLAASPNEQDARSAFTKLQKKYSELGAYQPVVKKVDNGQKTIYRLRVGNLSQDQAKTLCSQLQASGGSCFVVHN